MTARKTTKRSSKESHLRAAVAIFSEVLVNIATGDTLESVEPKIVSLLQSLPEEEQQPARAALHMMIGRVRSSIPRLAQLVSEA